MYFEGTWKNSSNGELIKLSGPNRSDKYLLEYEHDGIDFQKSETIPIYNTDDNHALLAHSEKFGRRDIYKIRLERFQVGSETFERLD